MLFDDAWVKKQSYTCAACRYREVYATLHLHVWGFNKKIVKIVNVVQNLENEITITITMIYVIITIMCCEITMINNND